MSTWIVTGGAGFIGSNFVRLALAETDARVVVADALTYAGNLENLRDVAEHPRFAFQRVDIAERAAVETLVREERPQADRELRGRDARRPLDRRPARLPPHERGRDARAARGLARALRGALAPTSATRFRFLHVSTDEVYGSLGAEGAFHETTPYSPRSPYSASKAGADHLVRAWHHTYGLPTLVTNCSNNYGPYQFPEKLIPLMILTALEGKPLPIYGDGGNVRDWLHVEDHCRAILRVLEAGRPGALVQRRRAERAHEPPGGRPDLRAPRRAPPRRAEPGARAPRASRATRTLKRFVADRPATTAATRSTTRKLRAELGFDAAPRLRGRHARRPCVVPRPTSPGASTCSRGATGASGSAWGASR